MPNKNHFVTGVTGYATGSLNKKAIKNNDVTGATGVTGLTRTCESTDTRTHAPLTHTPLTRAYSLLRLLRLLHD